MDARPGALELHTRESLRIFEVIGRIDLSRPCVATRSDRISCQVTVSRFYGFSLALELVDSPANWKWNLSFANYIPARHQPRRVQIGNMMSMTPYSKFRTDSYQTACSYNRSVSHNNCYSILSPAHARNLGVFTVVRKSSSRAVHASWVGALIYPRQTSIHHNSRPITEYSFSRSCKGPPGLPLVIRSTYVGLQTPESRQLLLHEGLESQADHANYV